LSAIVSDAVRAPAATGLKLTEMVQLAPAATVAPQVVVLMNDVASVPLILIPPEVIFKVVPPVFFSVTNLAALVDPTLVLTNLSVTGVKETTGAVPVAVPARLTACGDPVALSATLSEAVREPADTGTNLTEILQLAPAANVVPQVVVSVNDDGSAPTTVIPPVLMSRIAVLVFFNVTTLAALVDPTAVLAKVKLVGVKVTVGGFVLPAPVPVRLAVCGEPAALSAMFS
jgi:hypothetical protein